MEKFEKFPLKCQSCHYLGAMGVHFEKADEKLQMNGVWFECYALMNPTLQNEFHECTHYKQRTIDSHPKWGQIEEEYPLSEKS